MAQTTGWTVAAVMGVFLIAAGVGTGALVEVHYSYTPLGGTNWLGSYELRNVALSGGVGGFTIYFDDDLYANLFSETPAGLKAAWDEQVRQPLPGSDFPGSLDGWNPGAPLGPGWAAAGFSVRFDWLGAGAPGPQPFMVYDPDTFEDLYSGWTIPEPASIGMLTLGAALLRRRRW